MSPEIWTIISVGIVILIAIATTNRALRREMNERISGLDKRIDGLAERITAVQLEMSERFGEVNKRIAALRLEMNERFGEVNERIAALRLETNERIAAVRLEMGERFGEVSERLGRVEGLLEGIGFAQRKRAGKERSDGEPGPALPRS